MIKKGLLILLFLFPIIIYSKECDQNKHNEYLNLSPNISYDNNYSLSNKSYSIVIYNIFDDMYVKYNNNTYHPNNENTVTINGIKEGTSVAIDIYANDGCNEIKEISIIEPYYNEYFESDVCKGYENKIAFCSSQFTTSKVTLDLVEGAKYNYDNRIDQSLVDDSSKEEDTFLKRIKDFASTWGIKIGLVVLTLVISSTIYNVKYRKIKHGI